MIWVMTLRDLPNLFKEKFPKLYEEFLVDLDTTEIKVKYEKIGGANA